MIKFFFLFIVSIKLSFADDAQNIYKIAKKNIQNNIITIDNKKFLTAGKNQFRSIWTRDFCFSSEGLLLAGYHDLVRDHLNFLIANPQKKDFLMPLYMDSQTPIIRVLSASLNQALGTKILISTPNKLKPFYLINGIHPSIDSNILVLYAAMNYLKYTKDKEWLLANKNYLKNIYKYYDSKIVNGLIYQGPHSDWQDSAKREGFSFFTNLLYLQVSQYFEFKNENQLIKLKHLLHERFFDSQSGLYFSMLDEKYISLEGNLWAIEYNTFGNSFFLYENLMRSQLFNKYNSLGFATFPSYTNKELYSQVKISGLKEYHGSLYWSWLMNKSAKIAFLMNDFTFFNQQLTFINNIYSFEQ